MDSNGNNKLGKIKEHFDEVVFREKMHHDQSQIDEMLALSKVCFKNFTEAIGQAISTRDLNLIKKATHRLKGTAFTLEFKHLVLLLTRIESVETFEESTISSILAEISDEIDYLSQEVCMP